MSEPRLHELLALERSLVFAVLAQVAQLDRLPDLGGQRDVELVLEAFDLLAELGFQLFNHATAPGPQRGTPGCVRGRALCPT